jgi:hypothetical protein
MLKDDHLLKVTPIQGRNLQQHAKGADSVVFTCTFWNLIWKPWLVLNDLQTPKMPVEPALIVDAKALYDLLVKPEV